MPELPEVETIRQGLRPVLEGRRLVGAIQRRADLRRPFPDGFPERITGRSVVALRRRAKYLLADLDDGMTMLAHLGMSGRMLIHAALPNAFADHDHAVFITDEGKAVVFHDPRRFGLIDLAPTDGLERHPLLARLGPEPLDPGFSGRVLAEGLEGRRSPIKVALLDQRVVAGLGNIYASEALYASGIDPSRPAAEIGTEGCGRLAEAIRAVLERAIAAGGSSLRDYRAADGSLGYFQLGFAVYDREGRACPDCDCAPEVSGGVRRIVQGGRATFFCPRRQR